jgi:hypothetical protein
MSLYKYASPDRLDVLRALQIRFTQPGALNDPFELRPRFDALISESEGLRGLNATPADLEPMLRDAYLMLSDEQRAQLPYELAVSFFHEAVSTPEAKAHTSASLVKSLQALNNTAPRLREQLYELLNAHVGILSLSEVPDDILMWAHYADNHRGMLFGFDEHHEFFNRRRSTNDEFFHLRRVVYGDPGPAASLSAVDGDAFLVSKGGQWAYEREWRMLAPLKGATRSVSLADDVVYLFDFPGQAMRSVTLGARATAELESAVKDLCAASSPLAHVRVQRATLDLDAQQVLVASANG